MKKIRLQHQRLARWAWAVAVALAALVGPLAPVPVAQAAVLTVDKIGDGTGEACTGAADDCSLRSAIEKANQAAPTDTIQFAIPGVGPYVLTPGGPYDTIVFPVIIDGTTQAGYSGAPLIQINGGSAGAGANGLEITAGNSMVKGLAIYNFDGAGIWLEGSGNNAIESNYIGTNGDGTAAGPGNGVGVHVEASSLNAIGGVTLASRNVISGNDGNGVEIAAGGSLTNTIESNLIGLNAAGAGAVANGADGIAVTGAPGTIIGSYSSGVAQVISGNTGRGIHLSNAGGSGIYISNYIGVQADGVTAQANSQQGILLDSGAHSTVIRPAVVSNNGGAGLAMEGDTTLGNDNIIRTVQNNGGLPVDLGNDGPTANDGAGDPDVGPNTLLNFPESLVVASGQVSGTACAGCQVDLYKAVGDPRASGGGGVYLTTTTADGSGNWSIPLQCGFNLTPSSTLAAAAAKPSGVGFTSHSSEMSAVSGAVGTIYCYYLPLVFKN